MSCRSPGALQATAPSCSNLDRWCSPPCFCPVLRPLQGSKSSKGVFREAKGKGSAAEEEVRGSGPGPTSPALGSSLRLKKPKDICLLDGPRVEAQLTGSGQS